MGERLICCFTGHRRIRPEIMPELSALLDRVLDTLINDGVTEFRTGGAADKACAVSAVPEPGGAVGRRKSGVLLPHSHRGGRHGLRLRALPCGVYAGKKPETGAGKSFLHRLLYLCPGRKRLYAGLCEEPRLAGHQSFRHAEMIFCRLQCDFGEFGRKYLDFSGFQRYNKLG